MKVRMMGAAAVAAGLATLGGCVIDAGGDDDDRRRNVEFRCDDDRGFEAEFERERVTVDAGRRSYRLELEDRDGRRRRYGDGDVQLLVDGDETRLRIKDQRDYTNCEAR